MKTLSKTVLHIYLSFMFHIFPLRHMKLNQVAFTRSLEKIDVIRLKDLYIVLF